MNIKDNDALDFVGHHILDVRGSVEVCCITCKLLPQQANEPLNSTPFYEIKGLFAFRAF